MIDKRRSYIFYVAVDAGLVVAANDDTNIIVQRLNAREFEIHYTVALSGNGLEPAIAYGATGNIDGREAETLVEYYETIQSSGVDAQVIDQAREEAVWDAKTGWYSSPVPAGTYDLFLAGLTPPLQIIREEPTITVIASLALVSKSEHSHFNKKMKSITGHNMDHAKNRLSPTGDPPHTHLAGSSKMPESKLAAIETEFPVNPADPNDIIVLNQQGKIIWTNHHGHVDPVSKFSIYALVRDQNLIPLGKKISKSNRYMVKKDLTEV